MSPTRVREYQIQRARPKRGHNMGVQTLNLLDRGLADYGEVDQLQREVWAQVREQERDHTLILSQFQPVYTAGRNTHEHDILNRELPVVRTDRAGSITWHGPGQLVIYPVVKLREPVDLVAYIRAVEGAVLDVVRDTWELPAFTIQGRAGVWLPPKPQDPANPQGLDRKICAIGLKVVQATTLHGLALNLHPDFDRAFTGIIPCGLADAGVTSLHEEGREVDIHQAAAVLTGALQTRLSPLLAPFIG